MADSPLLKKITNEYVEELKRASPEKVKNAMEAYRQYARDLRKLTVSSKEIMTANKKKLIIRLHTAHIGRLCMFYYDPKLKKELPYYDRFPLIMPIELYKDGFLGLNFHYLPHKQRAILMDAINDRVFKNTHLSEKKRLQISYKIMKTTVKVPQYIPTIKRYLYTHLRSRINILDVDAWNMTLYLPLEQFEKATMARVHNESMRKIRNYGSF